MLHQKKIRLANFIINYSQNTQAYTNWSQMHKRMFVKHFQEFLVSVLRKLFFRHSMFFQFDTNRKRSKTDILFRNVCLFLPVFLLRYVLDLDRKKINYLMVGSGSDKFAKKWFENVSFECAKRAQMPHISATQTIHAIYSFLQKFVLHIKEIRACF